MNEKLKALKEIKNSYDAFYILNKYGDKGTHKKEFDILNEVVKNDDLGKRALNWIKHEYDCYYKENYIDNVEKSAFDYVEELIGVD
jgi:hypothetical protein